MYLYITLYITFLILYMMKVYIYLYVSPAYGLQILFFRQHIGKIDNIREPIENNKTFSRCVCTLV